MGNGSWICFTPLVHDRMASPCQHGTTLGLRATAAFIRAARLAERSGTHLLTVAACIEARVYARPSTANMARKLAEAAAGPRPVHDLPERMQPLAATVLVL